MPPILWKIEKLPGLNDSLPKNAGRSIDRAVDVSLFVRAIWHVLGACEEERLATIDEERKIVNVIIVTNYRLSFSADSHTAIVLDALYHSCRVPRTNHDLHWVFDSILLDGLPGLGHERVACTQHLDDGRSTALLP